MREQLLVKPQTALLATLENSKNYTLAVATLMPDNAYTFRPVEGVWDFRELMHHITHHRGQAVLYLRCKGLTPPEYMY